MLAKILTQENFGIRVHNQMRGMPARILEPPTLDYQNKSVSGQRGAWNMKDLKFVHGKHLKTWTALIVEDKKNTTPRDKVLEILESFGKSCSQYGLIMDGCSLLYKRAIVLNNDRDVNSLKTQISEGLKLAIDGKVEVVLVLLNLLKADSTVYSAVKYVGDVKFGIATVCSHWNKFSKKQPQYISYSAMKFNLKLGGSNHRLSEADLSPLQRGKIMLVGADVTHCSPGGDRSAPSIASVVASRDTNSCQFPCSLRLQPASNHEVCVDYIFFKPCCIRMYALTDNFYHCR